MNWMTVLWPMVTGACVTLALLNLRLALSGRRRAPHFFFASTALAVAVISGLELALMQTTDLVRYDAMLRWAVIPIGIMVASTLGFIRTFFDAGRDWLLVTAIGLNALAQCANLTSKVPAVRNAVALHRIDAYGNVHFTAPTIVNGPWNSVELTSVVLVIGFIFDASLTLWRRGGKRRAVVVGGGAVLFMTFARGHAILIEKGFLHTPYLVSFAFLGVLAAMGVELTDDVLHASRLARELEDSERRIDLAARAASLGFWTWDLRRDEIWGSSTALSLFGFSKEDRIDMARFTGSLHPDDRIEVRLAIEAAIASGSEYAYEYRVQRADGECRWVAARGRTDAAVDGRPTLMRGVVIDITAQRQSESELLQVRGQLAHAGRVTMLGQLASALAHELNQPLGAILRNTEAAEIFLQSATPDLDELRAIVGDIRKDDQRAGEVIDRLRALLKRRDLEARVVPVDELLTEATSLARADAASRRVTIEISTAADLPPIRGDRVHLQQVLLNLLLNAMDAMADCANGARKVSLAASRTDSQSVQILVRDTGPGIPSGKLGEIFEPFYTTKPNGMGMGLAISHTIVTAHGGKFWAANNDSGPGATIGFTLPIASEHSLS